MKSLHLFRVLNTASGISFSRAFQTGAVVLSRTRERKVPRRVNYEPGIRHREVALSNNLDTFEEIEDDEDLESDLDIMDIDKAYDLDQIDERSHRERIGRIITVKKFFKNPHLPSTLTCNERDCIRYLHKSDPVHWNVQTLSESFPATPEAIKKVLRGRFRPSEERKKIIDSKVQKNWELLADDRLVAPPEVLEHLKKFINKREVLLEQIKNEKFYLPEVKEEVVWNNGEMSNILHYYEKAVKKLIQDQELQNTKMLSKGSSETNSREEGSSLDIVHKKIDEHISSKDMGNKESFTLGGMIKTFTKPVTLEKLQEDLLVKADQQKELHLTEKAIVESVLGPKSRPDCKDVIENKSIASKQIEKKVREDMSPKSYEANPNFSTRLNRRKMFLERKKLEELMINEEKKLFVLPDSRTKFVSSNELGKLLSEVNNKAEIQPVAEVTEKEEIDDFKAERLRRENEYYAKEVKHLEDTAFWNSGKTSKDKALSETRKPPLGGCDSNFRGNVFSSTDVYPERIKIPEDKRGSGLTFRVRDCYYDDDGEFLYRVPGMVK